MSARHALSGLQLYRLLDRCLPAFGLDRQYRAIDVIKDFLSGVAHEKALDASAPHRTHDHEINALALHEAGHLICRITLDQMGVRLVQTKVPGQFLQVLFFHRTHFFQHGNHVDGDIGKGKTLGYFLHAQDPHAGLDGLGQLDGFLQCGQFTGAIIGNNSIFLNAFITSLEPLDGWIDGCLDGCIDGWID